MHNVPEVSLNKQTQKYQHAVSYLLQRKGEISMCREVISLAFPLSSQGFAVEAN